MANLTSTPTAIPQRPEPPPALPKNVGRTLAIDHRVVRARDHFQGAIYGFLLGELCRALDVFVAQCDGG